jgi:uncharacterized protein
MIADRARKSISGERTPPACWRPRKLSRVANFPGTKDCFGEPPKPTREPRVLPRMLYPMILGFILLASSRSFAAEVIPPKPNAYFNDYAGIVSKEAALRFNEELQQVERDTSNQVVVAVFPKMQSDSDIADYTQRVAQAWGVGQKERRNGVVLFIFVQDRKMFIQVGYGLEGALPDATAFDITEYRIKPHFRSGDYQGGLAEGIDSILRAIRGEYRGSGKTVAENRGGAGHGFNFALFIFFILVLVIISRLMRAASGYGYSSRRGGPVFLPMGFGGGGWSSGGGGGGGFSGGGGSFGGGGAGSSW